jgi:hypothetical protein
VGSTLDRFVGLVVPRLVRKQRREVERSVRVAALVGAAVGRFGTGEVSTLLQQHTEVRGRGRVTAPISASEGLLRFSQITPLGEQHPQVERSIRVRARVRAAVGRFGALEIASRIKQRAHRCRRGGVPACVSPPKRHLGLGASSLLPQQQREVERGVRKSPLVRSPVRRLGAGNIPSLFEQDAQIRRSAGVPELIGHAESPLGLIPLPLLDEQQALRQQVLGLRRIFNGAERYVELAQVRVGHGPFLNQQRSHDPTTFECALEQPAFRSQEQRRLATAPSGGALHQSLRGSGG